MLDNVYKYYLDDLSSESINTINLDSGHYDVSSFMTSTIFYKHTSNRVLLKNFLKQKQNVTVNTL